MEQEITKIKNLPLAIALLVEKIRQYEDAGFPNCENVMKLKREIVNIRYNKYMTKYPGYLFFSDKQFDEIVKRNNLKISTCETYTGNTPDHCFDAIKNEKIDKADFRKEMYTIEVMCNETNKYGTVYAREDRIGLFEDPQNTKIILQEMYDLFFFNKYSSYNSFEKSLCGDNPYPTLTVNITSKGIKGLYIAAPSDMIDKSKKKKPNVLTRIFVTPNPKDPIVFRYVEDGVLVITFWK
jgi:hypothetical protein